MSELHSKAAGRCKTGGSALAPQTMLNTWGCGGTIGVVEPGSRQVPRARSDGRSNPLIITPARLRTLIRVKVPSPIGLVN
jgi:hypothetical protein